MRILQVVPYFYPAWVYGGPVRVSYEISKKLVERGHEVLVYTSDMKDGYSRTNNESEGVNGIKVHYFRTLSQLAAKEIKLFMKSEMISTVRKQIKNFDVIHLHEYRTFQNIVVHHYAKKCHIPYVLQAHGSLPRIMAKKRLKWIYDALFGHVLLRNASKVIALSQTEAEQYRDMGVPEEKIEIIPNGIDLSEYGDLPPKGSFKNKFSIDDDEKIILYLGRIHQSKGLDLLAEAFSIVVKELENVKLVVVGPDDGYAAVFYKLISSLGIEEKVLLTGFVGKEDKLSALVESDVFVTPRFHGFPVTFLEACITGTPIITTFRGDGLGWIHNKVGLVVEYSPMKLAEAIIFLLTNDDTVVKMGDKAKQLVSSEFSIEKVVGMLEKLYVDAFSEVK